MAKAPTKPVPLDAPPLPEGDWVASARGIAAGYGAKLVLHDISATIPRGSITCIIGGSGCGKSTFLKSLVGLVTPVRGDIRVLGEDLPALEGEARAELLSRMGYMFQYGALLASITIADNLAIPMRAHTQLSDAEIREVVRMKLGLVHLASSMNKLPGELSGGMRKRAGLARAIMLDPELIFCDEPSAGLDPVTMADLDDLLLRMREEAKVSMVVVTHELASIRRIADRIVMLDGGYVHFDGTLEEADASDDRLLRDFFDRRAEGAKPSGTPMLEGLHYREAP